jgi:hypothetical protein
LPALLPSWRRPGSERKREKGERISIDGRPICEGRKNLREIAPDAIAAAEALNTGNSLRQDFCGAG